MSTLRELVEARPLGGYRVFVRFDDGVAGEVDLGALIAFEGVFAPLAGRAGHVVLPSRCGGRWVASRSERLPTPSWR